MMEKVSTLRGRYPDLDIEVDGGLSADTIDAAAKAGKTHTFACVGAVIDALFWSLNNRARWV